MTRKFGLSKFLAAFLFVSLALSLVACGGSTPTVTPTIPVVPVPDTPTPIIIVVTATPVPLPTATDTPVPPTATATQPAATPTRTVPPTATRIPTNPPSPTPACQELPIRGFGKVWLENVTARDYVGCPSYPRSEMGVDFTAQRFEKGVMFYTNAVGYMDKDAVLVLFADDKTWMRVVAPADAVPLPITGVPAGKYAPAGRIGWAWQQGAGVRTRLGWAIEPAKSGTVAAGTNAAWQAFSRGSMYWIPWNLPDDRIIYVVANLRPYPPGGTRNDWLEFKDTWNP